MKPIFLLLIICLTGCHSWGTKQFDADAAKFMLPVNLAASYFGTLGIHEGGHAATAAALGAHSIKVDILPVREDGHFHFGYTTAKHKGWNQTEETLFLTMGPTATYLAHVGIREALKTGYVPRLAQPTLAWMSLFCRGSYYFEVIAGLAQIEDKDLSKVDSWISYVMLVGALTYDVYDLLSDEGPTLRVLIGEEFYEPKSSRLKVVAAPVPHGGYLGLQLDW